MRQNLVVLSIFAAALGACSKPEPLPEPVRAVKLITVGEGGALATYEFSGEVRARSEQRLGFRVGGKIVKRSVEVGQRVKVGQLLAQLDPQDLKLALDGSRAQLAAAQTQVDLAAADFKRFKDLKDQNFISGAELDRREAALKAAQATADQARAGVSASSNQSGYASLLATASGVVVGVDAEAGQVVAAGAPVVRVAEDSGRDAVFAVPEDKVQLIKAGQLVALRQWAAGGAVFQGTVREVAAAADPVTRTYQVKVQLSGANLPLLGSTIYAVPAALAPSTAVLKLPTSALLQQGGQSVVWVYEPATSSVKAQVVVVATADGNDAVIAPGGLQVGQQVVAAGVHVLQNGQKVSIYGLQAPPQSLPKPAVARPMVNGSAAQ